MINCELLKSKRLEREWTQKEAAHKCGIEVQRYQLIETGKLVPNVTEIAYLAKNFKIGIADLLKKDNKSNKKENTLKEDRCRAGLTQVQLAEMLGVKQPQISMWEAGRVSPSDDMKQKIKEILSKGCR